MKISKVKLVNPNRDFFGLTLNKIYSVFDSCISEVTVINDYGRLAHYSMHGFEVVH